MIDSTFRVSYETFNVTKIEIMEKLVRAWLLLVIIDIYKSYNLISIRSSLTNWNLFVHISWVILGSIS